MRDQERTARPSESRSAAPLRTTLVDAPTDIRALVARNVRRGRSPAFVPETARPASVDATKTALLAEAARAASVAEAAALYGSVWRLNPTRDRARELRRAFAHAHPGSDLSDFVALKVADL